MPYVSSTAVQHLVWPVMISVTWHTDLSKYVTICCDHPHTAMLR